MKKYLFLSFFTVFILHFFCQIPDTLIPKKYSSNKIDSLKDFGTYDLTGKWQGRSFQFDVSGTEVIIENQIKASLEQQENKVFGKYTLKGIKGFFGKFVFSGVLLNNLGFFEEWKIKRTITPKDIGWCDVKSGKFKVILYNEEIYLVGDITSYIPNTNELCTPTYIILKKRKSPKIPLKEEQVIIQSYISSNDILLNTYPNPFDANLSVSYNLPKTGKVFLSLIDLTGKTMDIMVDGIQGEGYHHQEMDFSNKLISGSYILRLLFENKTYNSLVIKK